MPQYKYTTKKGVKWYSKFNYLDTQTNKFVTTLKRGFSSKREARAFEEKFLDELDSQSQPSTTHTVTDIYNEYLSSFKRSDMKQSTLQTKHNIFASHIAPYFEGIPVEEITAADIAAWQKKVKETKKSNGQPLSPAYLRTVQSQLNALINYASGKGYISINPLVDIKNMGVKGR